MMPAVSVTRIAAAAIAFVALLPMPASAAQLRVIVGFAAGSGVDAITRIVADRVRAATGMAVVVENRPGAGGRIAAEAAARSDPDGSTILAAPIVTTAFTPFVFKRLGFDPLKDLRPITRLGNFKFALAVNPALPVHSAEEFVTYVKANAGKVSYGTPGAGTPAHFLGAMFNRATGTDLVHVPYAGSGPAATALLGGQVQAAFNTTVALLPFHRDKRVRLLAVTGARRDPALPDVPTFAELKMGLGEMERAEMWYGLFAPGAASSATVRDLNRVLVQALNDPAVREKLQALDIEVAPDSPEEFERLVKADYDRWGPVIRSTGFTID